MLNSLPSTGIVLFIIAGLLAPFNGEEPEDNDVFETALMLKSKVKRSADFFDRFAAENVGFSDRLLVQVNIIATEAPGQGAAIGILTGLAGAKTYEIFCEAVKAYPVLSAAKSKLGHVSY